MIPATRDVPCRGGARSACFFSGLIVYVASFFLPAVGHNVGWECARRSLEVLILPGAMLNPLGILVLVSGLANPAVVVYVCFWVSRCSAKRRLHWAIPTAAFALVSCTFLALTNLTAGKAPLADLDPHVGYFAWIGSILLIVGGDLLNEIAKYVRIDY